MGPREQPGPFVIAAGGQDVRMMMLADPTTVHLATQVLAGGNGLGTTGPVIGAIIDIVLAVVCSRVASGKGRGPILWAILGLVFNFIALIVILVIPRKR